MNMRELSDLPSLTERRIAAARREMAVMPLLTARRLADQIRYRQNPVKVLIEGMTNWQRCQWARAGRPKNLPALHYFGNLNKANRHNREAGA